MDKKKDYSTRTFIFFLLALLLFPITILLLIICPPAIALAYHQAIGDLEDGDHWIR